LRKARGEESFFPFFSSFAPSSLLFSLEHPKEKKKKTKKKSGVVAVVVVFRSLFFFFFFHHHYHGNLARLFLAVLFFLNSRA